MISHAPRNVARRGPVRRNSRLACVTPIEGDDRHISLKKPLGDIAMSGGAYVALVADKSILDCNADLLSLNGDGDLVSQGFRVHDDGDTMEFTGKAYMKIYPKQQNQEGQGG